MKITFDLFTVVSDWLNNKGKEFGKIRLVHPSIIGIIYSTNLKKFMIYDTHIILYHDDFYPEYKNFKPLYAADPEFFEKLEKLIM